MLSNIWDDILQIGRPLSSSMIQTKRKIMATREWGDSDIKNYYNRMCNTNFIKPTDGPLNVEDPSKV